MKYQNQATLVRKLRLAKGLNQGELSKAIGYTNPQFISNWERGISGIPPKTFKKLAKALKVSPRTIAEAYVQDQRDLAFRWAV